LLAYGGASVKTRRTIPLVIFAGLLSAGMAGFARPVPGDEAPEARAPTPPPTPLRLVERELKRDRKKGKDGEGAAAPDEAAEAKPARAAGAPAEPPGPRPLPEIPQGGTVTFIPIHGTIDLGLAPFVERVIAGKTEEDLLVLDISTHGGRVDAAVVIRDGLLKAKARTVCWVNPRAISAGALISLACDVIAVAPGSSIGAATPVQVGGDGDAKPVEEKVVSYMRTEMRSTAEAKGRNGLIAEAMVDADIEVPGLLDKGKLLTMDGEQALAWGIAEIRARDEAELWKALGREPPATIERPTLSWAEKIARFLSDPILSGLLMTIGMLGILITLYSPGQLVTLVVGLVCLALFFFGHHVVKLAGWEEMLLFVLGILLIGFEVFVPGYILPGVLGALLVVASLVMALVNLEHVPITVSWRLGNVQRALATVFGSMTLTGGAAYFLVKYLPRTRFGQPLILAAALPTAAQVQAADGLAELVGQEGEATTDLRPAGKVLVGGRRHDAVSDREFVEAGEPVRVVRVERNHLVVRRRPKEPAS
jgi:membrane-bound serine protease (ClpP class)